MSAFDHSGADGQAQGQCAGIVQTVQSMAQIAIPVAPRSFCFRGPVGFQMFGHSGQHLLYRTALESLLLRASPWIRLIRPATGCGGPQIFADVEEVAQKAGWCAEHFPALQPDPIRAVSQRVNLTVQPPNRPGAYKVPTAVRFLPRSRRWRHTPWWCGPGLARRPDAFPSIRAGASPSLGQAALCRSSCCRLGQSPVGVPAAAAPETVVATPSPIFRGRVGQVPTWPRAPH